VLPDTGQNLELNVDDHAEITLPPRSGEFAAKIVKVHFNSSSKHYKRELASRLQYFAETIAKQKSLTLAITAQTSNVRWN
jgi:hypothetical protein